jgi:hypothetical protein
LEDILIHAFSQSNIDHKWIDSHSDKDKNIFIVLVFWTFCESKPCACFLKDIGFSWMISEMDISLDSVDIIGEIEEELIE